MQPKHNFGSALISALFMVSLVAIVATAMSVRLQMDIYRTNLVLASDNHYLAAQAVSFWAMAVLADPKNKFINSDSFGKLLDFPAEFHDLYPNITIKGSLYDLQSRFNLNNLVDQSYQMIFLKLIDLVTNKYKKSRDIMNATVQWLIPYRPERGLDPLTAYYLHQQPACLPSHQVMRSVSEFRLVKDVDANIYLALLPYITTLPTITPININTSSLTLLSAFTPQAEQLLTKRGEKGIDNINIVAPLLQKLGLRKNHFTVESQYFMTVATTFAREFGTKYYTIFKRSRNQQGKITVSIISTSM